MTDWRSSAAQTFVNGRITQDENYWRSSALGADIYQMIDDWNMWEVAFGGTAKKTREMWKTMLAMRNGPGSVSGVKRVAVGMVRGQNENKLGTDLLTRLQENVVRPLQALLRTAPLTINFDARGWFTDGPGFDEYITVWQRKKTSDAINTAIDPKNPPHVRAKADRWALQGQFEDGKAQIQAAGLNLPHVKRVNAQTANERMAYSTTKQAPGSGGADTQIFAALNYGNRPHGANTDYGMSVFELDDEYKKAAIFFAMDTFTPVSTGGNNYRNRADRSKLFQVMEKTFGGAILLAVKSQYAGNATATNLQNSQELVRELLISTRGMERPSTKETHLLIEAHLFQKVLMNTRCVRRVKIAAAECDPVVRANATTFHRRTGIPVVFA